MIVGGYTLDLYCDEKDCKHEYDPRWHPVQYVGELGSRCRKQARQDGWLLSRDEKTKCPDCMRIPALDEGGEEKGNE